MDTKKVILAICALCLTSTMAIAGGKEAPIYHAFILDADTGAGQDEQITSWELDGWIGGDYNKLWLKSEGEFEGDKGEQAEFWAMYSRNIAPFWDVQAGLRYDVEPDTTAHGVIGFTGLAPYFFETEAHLFISEEGDVSARLRQANEFLITQRAVIEPYLEANLFAQDIPERNIGAGLSDAEIGIQTRYEITREFAPYIDLRYERKFGETSNIAKDEGEDNDDFIAAIGIRFLF